MAQIILSGAVGFLVAIFFTPVLIRRFSAEGLGQEIRSDGPASHLRKRGTPTMGGIAIIAGIIAGYLVGNLAGLFSGKGGFTASGMLVMFLTLAMGALGFADDYIKLAKGRNLGLNKTGKLVGQLVAALIFAWGILQFKNHAGLTPGSAHLSFIRDITIYDLSLGGGILGMGLFLLFMYILVSAWTNAVNLTDGLDGLAAGSVSMVLGTYTVMTFWQFRNSCTTNTGPACYEVRDPLSLAIICAAGLGACLGFLWWNCAPAKIFMGDTGSLALGGLIAGVSVCSRTELLMIVIGSLFVIEAASVVIQVAVFKTRRKRFFRMAPFHHHFENGGWAETTVVIRFWLLSAMACIAGLALFYSEWLTVS
ncbi:phospho-N-acetylmuramoyl-pentapeptide-transferase [Corynebacterium mendelii]|uniref:Phospho-N-acetylmuramoyl-pentapeptide-transferase n=1 Tax=Corynebacterium mendelii TaxID=2765362 RepID=A0A939IST0_9CORY|nr:phospho-N-acetylmuramoyl-pentapeptide-transferase [Corynebacterium mendelii]MBN9643099.1 phospho-N-acetylmuramoyl-pentapeptide-transferase [Corynebacterium mendelii]